MQSIPLNEIILNTYDNNNKFHKELLDEFRGESHSNFISWIDNRLQLNCHQKSFPFDTGFVVSLANGNLIGYLFISAIRNDEVYLEYSILKDCRAKGYGSFMLQNVTDYLFENYNIRDIALDIDVSNEASMKTAIGCGYYEEEYLETGRVTFKNYNFHYIDKRRKRK